MCYRYSYTLGLLSNVVKGVAVHKKRAKKPFAKIMLFLHDTVLRRMRRVPLSKNSTV